VVNGAAPETSIMGGEGGVKRPFGIGSRQVKGLGKEKKL